MTLKFEHIVRIVAMVAITLLAIFAIDQCNRKNKAQADLHIEQSRGDTLVQSYNKLNQQVTKSYHLTNDLSATLAGLTEQVKDLKSKVKLSGSSVTYFSTFTPVKFNSKPFVIRDQVTGDLTFVDSLRHFEPWIQGYMQMSKDTSILDLNIKNDFVVAIGFEKRNFWKRDIPFAQITNLNPYTKTTDMKVYKVSMPKVKRFGLGIGVYGVLTTDFKFTPAIGAGLQYNLIRF